MLLLPSRGRPKEFGRFVKAYKDTAAIHRIAVRLDRDDPALKDYAAFIDDEIMEVTIGPRVGCTASVNELFERYPNEPVYGGTADDLMPMTPRWDAELAIAAGSWGISHGNDMQEQANIPTHPFIGGDLARAVGWLSLPGTWHLFGDQAWGRIGRELGCLKYCPAVVTEHLHFGNGKAPVDQTYQDHFNHGSEDRRRFNEWMAGSESAAMIKRVREARQNVIRPTANL